MTALAWAIRPMPGPARDELAKIAPAPTRFRVSWDQALGALGDELAVLDVDSCWIELAVGPEQLTIAGQLRAGAPQPWRGARVVFDHPERGTLTFGSSRWENPYASGMKSWRHNVYAVAKTLEALRAVDRYGTTSAGEQYRGFLALPPGGGYELGQVGGMTVEQARGVLWSAAGWGTPPAERNDRADDVALRFARRRTHPDAGGSNDEFNRIDYAARTLGLES